MGGGKESGGGMDAIAPYLSNMTKMSKGLWNESTPIRQSMLQQFSGFLGLPPVTSQKQTAIRSPEYGFGTDNWASPKVNVETMTPTGRTGAIPEMYFPYFSNQKANLERQFATGSDLLKGMTRGGAQDRALTDLVTNRATGMSNLYSGISQDAMNKLWGFTTGNAPQMAIGAGSSALGGAAQGAQLENQMYAMDQSQKSGKGQGMGGILGQMIGPKLMA